MLLECVLVEVLLQWELQEAYPCQEYPLEDLAFASAWLAEVLAAFLVLGHVGAADPCLVDLLRQEAFGWEEDHC